MRARHIAALGIALVILLALTVAAVAQSRATVRPPAQPPTDPYSVPALRADLPRLSALLRRCQDDPGGFGKGRECQNAHAARLAYTRDVLRSSRDRQAPREPMPTVIPHGHHPERRT